LAAFQAATPGLLEAVPPHLRSVLTSWSRLGRNSACIEDFTVAISTLPPGFIDARRTWTKLLADWLAHRASGNDPLDFSSPGGMALRQTMEAAARDADDAETYWLCRLFTPAGPPDARRPPPSAPISAAAQAGRLLCAVIEGSPLGELWNRFLRSSELQSRRPIRASDGIERLLALSLFAEAPKNIARALRFLANLGWGIEPLIILLVRGPAEIAAGRETLLAQGLRVFPDSEKLLELAVADAAARGDWPVALAHVRKMRNAHPGHARLGELEACVQEHILGPQLENARRTKRFGYYSDARARYEEILEVWPDCAEACFELARITDELRADIPRALELYHRALMAGWNAYDVHFHRGLLYFETNHGFESFKDLLTAASLRADCAVSKAIVRRLGTRECENWTNSAENWLNEGLLEQAAWVLETLAESDFATARIHYLYACTRSNRGQKDTKTLRHFELALQLGAPAFWVHYNRAFTHHALGNGPAAYEDLKEAARLDPSHSGVTWALKEWFPALSTP
jgi:tetratricopeptide (TPR) repeat protein